MVDVSARNLNDDLLGRLRLRAERNGRSMEAEIRSILVAAVEEKESENIVTALVNGLASLGGAEIDVPGRTDAPRATSECP